MKYVDVANTQDLKPGQSLCIELEGGQPIALFNVDGEIYALDNTCPHAGGPLGEGPLEGDIVSCPWHGWKFNVRTGNRLKNPIEEWRIASYPTIVRDNIIQVALPDQSNTSD